MTVQWRKNQSWQTGKYSNWNQWCSVLASLLVAIVLSGCSATTTPNGSDENANDNSASQTIPNDNSVPLNNFNSSDQPGDVPNDQGGGSIETDEVAAGPDQQVLSGQVAALSVNQPLSNLGEQFSFIWDQIGGPAVELDDPTSPTPRFLTPQQNEDVELVFDLRVSGPDGATSQSQVRVLVEGNRAPVSQAGFDREVLSGDQVVLQGCASFDPNRLDELTYSWRQLDGPVVVLQGLPSEQLSFRAPTVETPQSMQFELTAADLSGAKAVDTVLVTVRPPADEAPIVITSSWQNTTAGDVNIDIDWYLPDGTEMPIERNYWGPSGVEAVNLPAAQAADGLHRLNFYLDGDGRSAEITYDVNFLGYEFSVDQLLQGRYFRTIVLDVQDGVARVVYNGWLEGNETGAGQPTMLHGAEYQVGWRHATNGEVNVELDLYLPNGDAMPVWRTYWAEQGFESIIIPEEVVLEDGNYQLDLFLDGAARLADLNLAVQFPCYIFEQQETLQGKYGGRIGLDVTDGETRVVYNSLLDPVEPGSGGASNQHPLEVVAGWRNSNGGQANIDIDVELPNGSSQTNLPVWRNYWNEYGYERAFLPQEVELEDGLYEFSFTLAGQGVSSEVTYQLRFLDYFFNVHETLLGEKTYLITLSLQDGVVTELANTWR
ncbi:MAG: hypothetical protein HJJLKODD_01503 [Phycisphaerae bacterium]|nr:hypothetical protein [Phycisphaerae bacterium]